MMISTNLIALLLVALTDFTDLPKWGEHQRIDEITKNSDKQQTFKDNEIRWAKRAVEKLRTVWLAPSTTSFFPCVKCIPTGNTK